MIKYKDFFKYIKVENILALEYLLKRNIKFLLNIFMAPIITLKISTL